MAENKQTIEPIPQQFANIEEAAEFWDRHDLADYWEQTEAVDFDVNLQHRRYLVAIDPDMVKKLATEAHQ